MKLIGRHRNVVHLFEVLELIQETKSTAFHGEELFDLISSNTIRIPPEDRISEAFTAADHANHVAHHDMKPENLLVHNNDDLLGPQWFFPTESSPEARDLVIYMLNPDPDQRPSIQLVLQHPWLLKDATV
jgi:serine/threonine protein kinase